MNVRKKNGEMWIEFTREEGEQIKRGLEKRPSLDESISRWAPEVPAMSEEEAVAQELKELRAKMRHLANEKIGEEEQHQLRVLNAFTERELRLIANCIFYAHSDPAGLPGHNLMLIIEKLCTLYEVPVHNVLATLRLGREERPRQVSRNGDPESDG